MPVRHQKASGTGEFVVLFGNNRDSELFAGDIGTWELKGLGQFGWVISICRHGLQFGSQVGQRVRDSASSSIVRRRGAS